MLTKYSYVIDNPCYASVKNYTKILFPKGTPLCSIYEIAEHICLQENFVVYIHRVH